MCSQSAYVLDLQASFPLVLSTDEVALRWRRRALTLEEELQVLREKSDAEQIGMLQRF